MVLNSLVNLLPDIYGILKSICMRVRNFKKKRFKAETI